MIGEGDEVGDHTQQAVREELLVCGHSTEDLVLKDGNVHEELEQREDRNAEEYTTVKRHTGNRNKQPNKNSTEQRPGTELTGRQFEFNLQNRWWKERPALWPQHTRVTPSIK